MAMNFDGVNDEVVIAGTFDPPQQGTVAFWMKPNPDGTRQRILGGDTFWEVVIEPSNVIGNDLFAGTPALDGNTVLTSGTFFHVACTYNFSSNAMEIFLDGVSDGTSSNANDDPGTFTLRLGHRTGASSSEHFPGILDDVRIYDRVISLAEAAAIHGSRGTDGIVKGLIARWLLNEDAPGTVASGAGLNKDISGQGNNGTPTNGPTFTDGILRFRRKVS